MHHSKMNLPSDEKIFRAGIRMSSENRAMSIAWVESFVLSSAYTVGMQIAQYRQRLITL